jgi:hypothetical protein
MQQEQKVTAPLALPASQAVALPARPHFPSHPIPRQVQTTATPWKWFTHVRMLELAAHKVNKSIVGGALARDATLVTNAINEKAHPGRILCIGSLPL